MSANPFVVPEAFDVIAIGGEYMPGTCVVKCSRKHKWDEKKGKGTAGSTLTYAGNDLVEVDIELTLWEEEQYDEWIVKAPALLPDPKTPKALDAVHPHLSAVNVRSLVMLEVPAPVHKGGGEWTVSIKAKEFTKPKAAGGTPGGSAASSKGGGTSQAPPNAQSEQEKEIARLLEEAKKP